MAGLRFDPEVGSSTTIRNVVSLDKWRCILAASSFPISDSSDATKRVVRFDAQLHRHVQLDASNHTNSIMYERVSVEWMALRILEDPSSKTWPEERSS
jgi:hypothetical protein